jgi:MFS transporter, FSR family, fosmidomycin resistance protein
VLAALAFGFWMLLIALLIANPASGAFVSLAQATLMDGAPAERERNMARWTAVGSVGYVVGPLLIAAGVAAGGGWRVVLLLLALPAIPLGVAVRPAPVDEERADWHGFLAALRDRRMLRSLALLEAADLMLDVFHAFLALYAVDVAGTTPVADALAVSVWTTAGLAGDVLLLWLLRRLDGTAYLRASAAGVLAVYPAFLVVPSTSAKLGLLALLGLLNAGWYVIPKAVLYAALPGRSGVAVAVSGAAGMAGAVVPAAVGALASAVWLASTMWVLFLAPIALLAGLRTPRR